MAKKKDTSKIKKVMEEWKKGKLRSSDGTLVTDQDQALAIAISEQKKKDKGK